MCIRDNPAIGNYGFKQRGAKSIPGMCATCSNLSNAVAKFCSFNLSRFLHGIYMSLHGHDYMHVTWDYQIIKFLWNVGD